jgi:hypothetical protein
VDNVLEDVHIDMFQLYINIDHAENQSIPRKDNKRGKQAEQKEKPAGLDIFAINI